MGKTIHLTLGEEIGIAVGGVVLLAALALGIWCCCCRRKRRNRTQTTYVEPYRSQGVGGYSGVQYGAGPGTGCNAGYAGYAGQRGVDGDGDGDSVPLRNVGFGRAQECKPPVVESELGGDERSPGVEMGYDERR